MIQVCVLQEMWKYWKYCHKNKDIQQLVIKKKLVDSYSYIVRLKSLLCGHARAVFLSHRNALIIHMVCILVHILWS